MMGKVVFFCKNTIYIFLFFENFPLRSCFKNIFPPVFSIKSEIHKKRGVESIIPPIRF
jgi:hypothetical protein